MGLVAASACVTTDELDSGTGIGTEVQGITLDERIAACRVDPRVVVGKVSVDVCVGADLFLRETFNGNGRSCGTCHPVERNFTIDPDFLLGLEDNDPLFVAEFNPALSRLEVPDIMRRFGLILENVDGFADPTRKFVLRSVPHTLSMGTSVTRPSFDPVNPPTDRTGWSGDGAPGAGQLRDFQNGAITQHYTRSLSRVVGTDFRLATPGELDRIDLFMRRVGRTSELDLAVVRMSDAGAEAGRIRFRNVGCDACHNNAGANAGFGGGGNANFNTGVESARNEELFFFPHDGGFLASPQNPDGSFGDGTFNAPPLVEAADTGPFFHTATSVRGASAHDTDTATTIEEAIAFYDTPAFNTSPAAQAGQIDLTALEIDNIGRFLRGVNSAFNVAMSIKRLDAAEALRARFGNDQLAVQRKMLRLALIDMQEALVILTAIPGLNQDAVEKIGMATQLIQVASTTDSIDDRRLAIFHAINFGSAGAGLVGANLTFQIGEGTVMF
jgi:hypothetical protein